MIVIVESDSDGDNTAPPRMKRYKICSNRRSFLAASMLGISPMEFRCLKRRGLPKDFFQLLLYSHAEFHWIPQTVDITEWMSGVGEILRAGNDQGFCTEGFEVSKDNIFEDFLSPLGFLNAIRLAKSAKPLGCQHWDTVCSSYIWVCRNDSKRSIMFPMGDTSRLFVLLGNQMVSRMVLVACLMRGKKVLMFLEQPLTSLMDKHKRMNSPAMDELFFIKTWMGCFGGPTPKPSKIYASEFSALLPLKRKMTGALKKKLKSEGPQTTYDFIQDGRLKTTGNKQVLKTSQVYPPEYGVQVVKSWKTWRQHQVDPMDEDSSDSDYDERARSTWPEADLQSVIAVLQDRHGILPGHF